jgi:hypothetical protein
MKLERLDGELKRQLDLLEVKTAARQPSTVNRSPVSWFAVDE